LGVGIEFADGFSPGFWVKFRGMERDGSRFGRDVYIWRETKGGIRKMERV
jgi:hypothetical protein